MKENYVKGFLSLAVVAIAISAFLAWPNSTASDSTEIANTNAQAIESGEVIKASLSTNEEGDAQTVPGQEMIDRAKTAADNQDIQQNSSEKADLEINVVADPE
tara:strand:+ start:104 stop:412 length:309 start_codon:yes stop_codon:yes gene_type:complete